MFVRHEERPSSPCGSGCSRKILAYSEEQMLAEVTLEKGAEAAVHQHPHRQISYVVRGSVDFRLDGRTQTLREGDSVSIAADVPHGLTALEDSLVLDIFTPMREDFL